jgi:hypothetical protein
MTDHPPGPGIPDEANTQLSDGAAPHARDPRPARNAAATVPTLTIYALASARCGLFAATGRRTKPVLSTPLSESCLPSPTCHARIGVMFLDHL